MDNTKIKLMLEQVITQIEKVRDMVDVDIPKPPPEAIERAKQEICLACGKPYSERKERPIRGLHNACWTRVKRIIDSGQRSENDFIRSGWLLPAQPGGRPAVPFLYEELESSDSLKVAEPRPEETKPDPATPPKKHKRIPK